MFQPILNLLALRVYEGEAVSSARVDPSYLRVTFQARSKHKMTGGTERVAHINSPSRFGPSVKAYFLVHVRSLHLFCLQYLLFLSLIFRLC